MSHFLDEGFYPSLINFCLAGHRLSRVDLLATRARAHRASQSVGETTWGVEDARGRGRGREAGLAPLPSNAPLSTSLRPVSAL